MVETNKIFRGSDQFNVVARQYLIDNANRFIKVGDNEYRLFLPYLCDMAVSKPNCINQNVQRYRDCLISLSAGKSSVRIIIFDQFDQEMYRELGGFTSWVRDLYRVIEVALNNIKFKLILFSQPILVNNEDLISGDLYFDSCKNKIDKWVYTPHKTDGTCYAKIITGVNEPLSMTNEIRSIIDKKYSDVGYQIEALSAPETLNVKVEIDKNSSTAKIIQIIS